MPVNNQPHMLSGATHPIGHAPYLIPRPRTRERVSVFASLVLGLTFNASLISVVGSAVGVFPKSVGNAIAAGSLIFLILVCWSRSKNFKLGSLPQNFKMCMITLCVTCLLVGGYGIAFSPYRNGVILKMGGVLISIYAMACASRYFNFKEVALALKVFSFVELLGCVAMMRLGGDDVNENTIAVRATVACMCLFTLLGPVYLRWAAFAGCLAFSLKLGCRTSAMALLGATTFLYVEKNSRRQRGLVLFLAGSAFVSAIVLLPFIMEFLSQLAIASLGSDNPVAKFFLHDKTSDKISYDYLDRFEVWSYAWEFVREKPWMGYGLGSEKAVMLVRCHNAYMSLLFEGGIFWLLAWVWFYGYSVVSFFNRRWLDSVGQSGLFALTAMLLFYMLLAGLVESSGLASVSTPNNLIFIFLIVWLFQPDKNARQRPRFNRNFSIGR